MNYKNYLLLTEIKEYESEIRIQKYIVMNTPIHEENQKTSIISPTATKMWEGILPEIVYLGIVQKI